MTCYVANIEKLEAYIEREGKTYHINSHVEALICAIEDIEFDDLEELDDFTWGVNVSSTQCSFRIFSSIKPEQVRRNLISTSHQGRMEQS